MCYCFLFCASAFGIIKDLLPEDFIDPDINTGFQTGGYNYYVINLQRSREAAAIWCRDNLDAVLPVPDTEYEYEVSTDVSVLDCIRNILRTVSATGCVSESVPASPSSHKSHISLKKHDSSSCSMFIFADGTNCVLWCTIPVLDPRGAIGPKRFLISGTVFGKIWQICVLVLES